MGALSGVNHALSPDIHNTIFLPQGSIIRAAFGSREGKWNTHLKRGQEVGTLQLPWSNSVGQMLSHTFLMTFPNTMSTTDPFHLFSTEKQQRSC